MTYEMDFGLIDIAEIEIGERARAEIGDTTDIEESAKGFAGQIQSIALKRQSGKEKPYKLMCGGRRVPSFAKVGITSVLARIYPEEMTLEEEKSIELIENVARLSMTWQDQLKLTKDIHESKISMLGQRTSMHRPSGSHKDTLGWSQADTARMLGISVATVNRDLSTAAIIEKNPELKKCKNRKEADNAIAKLAEKKIAEELARRHNETEAVSDIDKVRRALIDRYNIADFFEGVKSIPDESIDFVDLDPPYGIGYDKLGDSIGAGNNDVATDIARAEFTEFPPEQYIELLTKVLSECYRVMKKDSWLICWFAQEPWFEPTFQAIKAAGFNLNRVPGVWNKNVDIQDTQASSFPDYYLGRTHECFFYARKGTPVIVRRARADVFNFSRTVLGDRTHPTEKPIALMQEILQTFILPGSRILVPFLGSGNTILAGANSAMLCSGFELGAHYKNKFINKVMEWEIGK